MTPKVILLGLIVLIGIGVAVGQQVRNRDDESAVGKIDAASPVQNNPEDRSVPQVQAWLKENVNIPGLRIIEWGDVERTETGYRVWVSYLGKNAVGGDAVVRRTIKFDAEGNITRVY